MKFENPIVVDGGVMETNGATTFGPDGSIIPFKAEVSAAGITEGVANMNVGGQEESKEEEKTQS